MFIYQDDKMQTPSFKSQVIKLDSPRPHVFIVRLHDEKNRIIERSFCASSEEDRQNWCQAFEQVRGSLKSRFLAFLVYVGGFETRWMCIS